MLKLRTDEIQVYGCGYERFESRRLYSNMENELGDQSPIAPCGTENSARPVGWARG